VSTVDKRLTSYVGFEVLTAVSTKMAVFWALQPRRQPSSN
jgi:hypothetical protein